jgi:hypothetical protein
MVSTFLISAVGLGPVFDSANPLDLRTDLIAGFAGSVTPSFAIDTAQIHRTALQLGPDQALRSLCCMLVNTAYETVAESNDQSPEFEFFQHVRNAASHGNVFNFFPREPTRPASWRSVTIDTTLKGTANPLHGSLCFGGLIAPADAIALLSDIEQKLP